MAGTFETAHTVAPSQIATAELESAGALAPVDNNPYHHFLRPAPPARCALAAGRWMAPKKTKSKYDFKGVLVREFGR